MTSNNPSAPPLDNRQRWNYLYPKIENTGYSNYHHEEYHEGYDKNINDLEQKILSITGNYKYKQNTSNDYRKMKQEINELISNFKKEYHCNNEELPNINHHYSNKDDDNNFEKFEQHFKMCEYYFSKGQKELFERIQIIKNRKKELKDMRCIPANITRKVFDEIKSYEKLLDTTKNAFQHKYGNYSKFKKKIKEEIKEDKKRIGSYKKFMNKYL